MVLDLLDKGRWACREILAFWRRNRSTIFGWWFRVDVFIGVGGFLLLLFTGGLTPAGVLILGGLTLFQAYASLYASKILIEG